MAVPFGKYQLLRKIASGGMGQVYLALEQGTGFERLVVLKLILPHLAEDEEFLGMFLEEARLVARLQHPNLITILELTEIDGRYCLAMEYVQGDDVRRMERHARAQGKPLPMGLVLRVVAEAAAGLDYAHHARDAHGQPLRLVHRDVSPQNILVGFDGGVKVIDFGVAKAAGSSSNTATGVLKGKYPYMSPEQAAGQPIDARSDQFALGVVLWELLTNRRLFKGESNLMTLRLVRDCQVPPPSQLNPQLPRGLDELVLKALSPTPEGRFPDCGAFRLALEDYLLQHRLPASNAHLSAWLRDVYAERIAREEDPSTLDQIAEELDLDAKSNASRSSMRSASQQQGSRSARLSVEKPTPLLGPPPDLEFLPASTPNMRQTQTLAPVALKRRRSPLVPVAAALGGVLLAAGAAVILLRQSTPAERTSVVQEAEPPREPPRAAESEPPPPREPQRLALRVMSEPLGAKVLVDGEPRGATPVHLALTPAELPVTVALRLEGYEPVSRKVSAEDGPEVLVKLTPKPEPRPPPPPRRPLDIKMGR
jgi:eukaryotic-like serine/threonine-protein kinase